MTQSSLQTQCPNCQTRFRVTDEQLGIAKGKVRCGSCMSVFNAIEHQVIPASGQKAGTSTASERPSPQSPASDSSGVSEEDFVFADNPEEDAAEGRYAGTKLTFSDDELSDSFRSFDEREATDYKDADTDTSNEDVDESWAEAILKEDEPASRKQAPAPRSAPAPKPEPELRVEQEPVPDIAPSPAAAAPEPAKTDDPFDDFVDESGFDFDEPDRPGGSFHAEPPFRDLRRDPIGAEPGKGGGIRTLVWSLIVLSLVGVLVAQVTWFQFDRLSAIPELRPFYEKGCELAGCKLKPLINVDAIQSRKLVVRTDPDNRSQLVVDAVIINRADFEQPFPAIALTFSNLNGDVVAQSVFTPDEYLAGEGKELNAMPTDTPVRIAISIRDPGRDAVNYNILFRPHSP
ncbi:DUF3426 domain-containing protein [Marinobacter sp.]|uniref:DUF3426 domain-containing protein n=1 Tax=Marinobacter sp. TaxID=50741 RepID=UPI003A8D3385